MKHCPYQERGMEEYGEPLWMCPDNCKYEIVECLCDPNPPYDTLEEKEMDEI